MFFYLEMLSFFLAFFLFAYFVVLDILQLTIFSFGIFVHIFVLFSFHIFLVVFASFVVVFERRIVKFVISQFNQCYLAAGVNAQLFECFFKTVWSYVGIFFFPFVLHHHDAFVLSSHHKSIPHYCLVSHCLLEFVLRVNLQRLLISVSPPFHGHSDVQIYFESNY